MAIRIIEGLPDNVLGFEALGKVSGDDYKDVIMPAVETRAKQHPKIRMLYVLGAEFESYSPGALWDDARVGLSHMGSFEKIAFVTDHDVYRTAVKAFGFAMPGDVKVFEMAQLDDATKWVAA